MTFSTELERYSSLAKAYVELLIQSLLRWLSGLGRLAQPMPGNRMNSWEWCRDKEWWREEGRHWREK